MRIWEYEKIDNQIRSMEYANLTVISDEPGTASTLFPLATNGVVPAYLAVFLLVLSMLVKDST
jgi:hypothetical protein